MNEPSLFDAIQQSGTVILRPATQADVDKGVRGRGRARTTDPQTSHDAAAAIGRGAEQAIRAVFAIPRDLTADEIHALCPEFERDTLRSALSRLNQPNKKTGAPAFLVKTGEQRLSLRGHKSTVWRRA